MRRIWILAIAVAMSCAPAPAQAQQGAPSLAERLAFFSKSDKDDGEPPVQQTAAHAPRLPRDKWMSGNSRKSSGSGGGLLSGLGRIFSRSSDSADDEAGDSSDHYPMPYDPTATSSDSGQTRRTASPRTDQQRSPGATTNAPGSPQARMQLGPQPGTPSRQRAAAPSRTQRPVVVADESRAATAPAAVSRQPRKSPTTSDSRGRSELDEALADLQASPTTPRRPAGPSTDNSADANAAPDYLDALEALAEPAATPVARGPAPQPAKSRRGDRAGQTATDFGRALSERSQESRQVAKSAPAAAPSTTRP